tara:strand:+ start:1328 stop:2074 length:747 start_codon:yes stop_codon:yes gene_type:complete
MTRILFSNLGYARGIDGSLQQITRRFHRLIYCRQSTQETVLRYLKHIIVREDPDLCCFVEIHSGGRFIGKLNQLQSLLGDEYPAFDIANKYGDDNFIRHMPLHRGRSNAFMAKKDVSFDRVYFPHGTKRLIYNVDIGRNTRVLFTHFSLNFHTRKKQFSYIANYLKSCNGHFILLADFNIFQGFTELDDFIKTTGLVILNKEDDHTFQFYKRKLALDLCICSPEIVDNATLKIIDQPFSDHDALLLEF